MKQGFRMSDFDSTLVRRARSAVTFSDMVEFATKLELRPLVQLLEELPDLARLSSAKFDVAMNVLRRRFRTETPIDQLQIRTFGMEIADRAGDMEVAERIRNLFELEQG